MSLREQSRQPGLFETALLAAVERAINTALRHDPASLARFASHSGKLLEVELTLPPLRCYVLIVDDGLEVYHSSDAGADTRVRGSPLDLAAQLLGWTSAPSMIGGPLQIRGDRELLQEISQIVRDLDIDWGGVLAPWLGDELAQQLDYGARQLFSQARSTFQRLGDQLGEYLREEGTLTPSRRELREFCHDVDELVMDTDRLEARIRRLHRGSPGQ